MLVINSFSIQYYHSKKFLKKGLSIIQGSMARTPSNHTFDLKKNHCPVNNLVTYPFFRINSWTLQNPKKFSCILFTFSNFEK